MTIALSYAIMTHNELTEFGWLMNALRPALDGRCEIVVLDDFSNPEMTDFIKSHDVRFYQRALNKNFSAQRNHLKSLCRGEFVFFLDPDEMPPQKLLNQLPDIVAAMKRDDIDVCVLPRLNILVDGEQPVDARTLVLSDADLLNRPRDDQTRILRNRPDLQWTNHVHERLIGVRRGCRLPQKLDYALLHCKTHARHENQNRFYRSIAFRYLDKLRKSIAKRRGRLKQPEWVEIKIGAEARP